MSFIHDGKKSKIFILPNTYAVLDTDDFSKIATTTPPNDFTG
jgi:hypothetical protein